MIDRPEAYSNVILVQSALAEPASRGLRRQAKALLGEGPGRILVFFHAAAASLDDDAERRAWATLASGQNITLAVCQAARARRVASELEEPFEASSLVRFWDAVLGAENLFAPGRNAVQSGGFLVRITHQATEQEAREYLEMVLAGASLELDLVVLFEGDGLSLLAGERARPWAQLVDHGLARMVTTSAEPASALIEPVDAELIDQWRTARCWIEP